MTMEPRVAQHSHAKVGEMYEALLIGWIQSGTLVGELIQAAIHLRSRAH